MATADLTIRLSSEQVRRAVDEALRDTLGADGWDAIAEAIGTHDYQYDLSDSSERLDVVQVVCEAICKILSPSTTA